MTLTPQQRQASLEVMGITVYRQRVTLPGAARDQTVIWPPLISSRTSPSASAILDAPLERRAAPLQASPAPDQAANSAAAPDAGLVVESPAATAGKDETTLRYRVVLLPVNDRLSIIEQLPETHEARLTLRHLHLLNRVLASLGMPVETETMQQLPFQWPMGASRNIDGSAMAGRSSLRVFAESNMVTSPEHVLWLMGEGFGGLAGLFSLDEAHQPLGRTPGLPWRVLVTAGLSQILQVPSLKLDLWRQLAVLRRFLRDAGSL